MKCEYQKLMGSIHAPEGLHRRVLEAAREKNTAEETARRRTRPALRAAACAVLALVLVAGGVTLYPRRESTMEANGVSTVPSPPLTYAFGLTAHAAGANGSMILQGEEGGTFRIAGEDIAAVTMEVEGGTLSRGETNLGSRVTEAYDPAAEYAVQITAEHSAMLTVTAEFSDGEERSCVYRLSAEKLRAFSDADGTEVLVPGLAGDEQAAVSGLYAAPEDGVYFLWPVEGAHTVSLSAPYGLRADGTYFHSGIDIPARQGTSVLAAAAGTVTEVGFDAAQGNYLILDHGDGMETMYAHCLHLAAEAGDAVAAGEEIAAVGATGMATGPHLHFEVRQSGNAQNPIAFFDAAVRDTLKMG